MKYIVFTLIMIAEYLILVLLSNILNVGLYNTWLAVIGVNTMSLTICAMLLYVGFLKRKTQSNVSFFLFFCAFIIIITMPFGIIAFFAGW